ncbi:hypothetical protein [Sorangium sp. So ce394]|uniref:Uncharacterized protein n=1 Tax=Sorangium cellulosum TaxID=56 RepID=A0A150SS04_SORCE|nr:hypothetical protein BE20_24715 [Sorangium cellulosum]KYF94977.1 hypothetical protein BE18_06740 [Sorangium cellulosum]
MGWWHLPGSEDELIGDPSADAAADLLAPLETCDPRPTLDELLDALEAALRLDPPIVSDALGDRAIVATERPRTRGAARTELVELLRPGAEGIAETYRSRFQRLPSLREMLASILFVLRSEPNAFLRDHAGDKLEGELKVA